MRKLLVLLLLAPVLSFAQSPFDGTWKTNLDTAQFPKKPDDWIVDKGMYHCQTCVPKVSVKADGTDQPVTGHPYYDTVAVKIVDPNTVEITEKKNGKVTYTDTRTVASDGKSVDVKFTDSTEDKPVNGDVVYTRVDKGPAGSHAVSGKWRFEKANNISDNGLRVTYQVTGDGLKMQDPNGASYDAKFDGKEYPVQGDPGHTMVIVKRINDHTIEEIDRRDGKEVGVSRMTVSPDGKSIHVVYTDKLQGTTMNFTMDKQT